MSKRIIILLITFIFIFTSVIARVGYISLGKVYKVNDNYNSIKYNINKLYTNIYSREGYKLNNCFKDYRAIVRPNERAIIELDRIFDYNKSNEIREELRNGYPVIVNSRSISTPHIQVVEVIKENQDNMPCRHLIDKSCGGLEYYTDEVIGSLDISFNVDAVGRVLSGDEGRIINDNYDSRDGIVISIDKDIQDALEKATAHLDKGCAIILDTKTSQVLASVSKGNDYLNRALCPYAVGSIFKLVVSACALENNVDLKYNCIGEIKVGELTFHCQNKHKHGKQNMNQALANSCNCYYVNLALRLGKDKLLSTAKSLGFGDSFTLYDSWIINAGSLPDSDTLSSQGQLALLGFGQGALTDTPLHFASVISTISNGGYYCAPTLSIENREPTRVMSANTSKKLMEYMKYVVTNGTGINANYNNNSAGKTATAQSGIYTNGTEQLNTWFAGFYPYDNPKYSIVIMREGGVSGAEDCCPIFRTVVEMLDNM